MSAELTGMSPTSHHASRNPGEALAMRPMATIALLALADVVTTYLGLNGRDDANPFVAGLLRDHGYSGLVVAKAMLVVLALLVTRLRPEVRRLAWVMVIPCFAVGPVWNLLVMAGFRWP